MSDPIVARFAFKSGTLDVEIEGHVQFVEAQIAFLRPTMHRSIPAAGQGTRSPEPARAAAAPPVAPAPSPAAAPVPSAVPSAPEPKSAAVAPAAPAAPAAPTLDEFYRSVKSRDGRGALTESILIFAYFLREQRGKEEFGMDNLNACFSVVGAEPPASLANTMGILKRTNKYFQNGSRRGQYVLTDKGAKIVRALMKK